jgi:alanine dehydrogenase
MMLIGLPKEIKDSEARVGLTPGSVKMLTTQGHQVLVETGAGQASFMLDAEYQAAGATIVNTAQQAWAADMVVKVKEPLPSEYGYLRDGLILFTYLHLAASQSLTHALMASKTIAIAYETVQLPNGQLPLLIPMSEVAGRMASQVGANLLQKHQGGRGVLMGGVPGVAPADVLVLGGGTVGANATRIAAGMGAKVTVVDISHDRLAYFDDLYQGKVFTRKGLAHVIAELASQADLIIGAVLVAGGKAPKLISHAMLATLRPGAVIVDVAVDQGGCFETSKPTTHSQPTYEVDGIVHYCVANMPGAVPRTSTFALNNQTADYVALLANQGLAALRHNSGVAAAFGVPYVAVGQVLG